MLGALLYLAGLFLLCVRWHSLVLMIHGRSHFGRAGEAFLTSVVINYAAPVGLAVPSRAALTKRALGLSLTETSAVALDGGLIVPVIKNADEKNVTGLQRSIADLAARARSKQLKPDDVSGGTFSITNFGSFGSLFATPVINQPQVAILGLHKIQERPVVVNGKVEVRPMMYVALSYDHRIIDGQQAVLFLVRVKELMEDPASMLIA